MADVRIILASGSPRRKELLSQLGVSFDILVSNLEEHIDPNLLPHEVVENLALLKARAIAKKCDTDSLIIGADTIILFEDQILGKPKNEEDAKLMLSNLCGREHLVITGVAFIDNRRQKEEVLYVTAKVTMNTYSLEEIDAYVATGEPMDKAAGYAIQGLGRKLIQKYEGCYTGIVGLPLCKIKDLLIKAGVEIGNTECRLDSGELCPNLKFKSTSYNIN